MNTKKDWLSIITGNVKLSAEYDPVGKLELVSSFLDILFPGWVDDVCFLVVNARYQANIFIIDDYEQASYKKIDEGRKPFLLIDVSDNGAEKYVSGYKRLLSITSETSWNGISEKIKEAILNVFQDETYISNQYAHFKAENEKKWQLFQGDDLHPAYRILWDTETLYLAIDFDYYATMA